MEWDGDEYTSVQARGVFKRDSDLFDHGDESQGFYQGGVGHQNHRKSELSASAAERALSPSAAEADDAADELAVASRRAEVLRQYLLHLAEEPKAIVDLVARLPTDVSTFMRSDEFASG